MQLQLPETEDLRVLFLSQIIAQLTRGNRLVIHTFHLRLVQQVLVLRHEFRRVAGGEKNRQKHYVPLFAHKYRAKLQFFLHICKFFSTFVPNFVKYGENFKGSSQNGAFVAAEKIP
jgi:hypothetical protein